MLGLSVQNVFIFLSILIAITFIDKTEADRLIMRPTKSNADALKAMMTRNRVTTGRVYGLGQPSKNSGIGQANIGLRSQTSFPYMMQPRPIYREGGTTLSTTIKRSGSESCNTDSKDTGSTVSTTINKGGYEPKHEGKGSKPDHSGTAPHHSGTTESIITIRYTGPSTPSTRVMYARGQSPHPSPHNIMDQCKNAACQEVMWGDVIES